MNIMFWLFAVAAGLSQAPSSSAVGPWKPLDEWVVGFDEDRCAGIREYARGTQKLRLNIMAPPMSEWIAKIEVPGIATAVMLDPGAKLYLRGAPMAAVTIQRAPSAQSAHILYTMSLNEDADAKLRQAGSMRLTTATESFDVPLPGLRTLERTLDICVANLLESWGVSKAEMARLSTFPKPSTGRLNIKAEDYPTAALARDATGAVRVRSRIGADGRTKDCAVQKSSGNGALDRSSCSVVRRTKFKPATDLSGRVVEAPYVTTVRWLIVR